MISGMNAEQRTTIDEELKLLEKLHRAGDQEGARIIATRILLSQTLTEEDKRRINRVINADKIMAAKLAVAVLVVVAMIYFFMQYAGV